MRGSISAVNDLRPFLSVIFVIWSASVWAEPLPYVDSNFECTTAVDAQRYVQDFRIDLKSFGGEELCDSNRDSKKLYNDLQIIEKGKFVASIPHPFVRGFIADSQYYEWIKKQTRSIERKNDLPYATAYNIGGFFTMQSGWSRLSTLGRVGAFIHEARHTEGFKHVVCDRGSYQETRILACERNFAEGGSFAVEMEYYARVATQGVNFHPVYKKMARLMAMARSPIFFNTAPVQSREGLLALSLDGKKSYLFDGQNWIHREIPAVQAVLKRTSFGAVLFDGLNAFSIDMYQNAGSTDPIPDQYSYFKLIAENKKSTFDFEEFDQTGEIFFVHISKENILTPYDFSRGTWGADLKLPFSVVKTSTALPGQLKKGYYLISSNSEVYAYQPESQRLVRQTGNWDAGNKNVVSFNNQSLILRNDNRIYVQSSQKLIPWDGADLKFSDLVTVPLYDAFQVVKE